MHIWILAYKFWLAFHTSKQGIALGCDKYSMSKFRKLSQCITGTKIDKSMKQKRNSKTLEIYTWLTTTVEWAKCSLFNMELAGSNVYMKRKEKTSPYLAPYIKLNSRWVVDLNVKGETIKLLQDKHRIHSWHRGKEGFFKTFH